MKAVICPVCLGTGKVGEDTCHGCGGKGWVEVGDDKTGYAPYYSPWYPSQPWYYYPDTGTAWDPHYYQIWYRYTD